MTFPNHPAWVILDILVKSDLNLERNQLVGETSPVEGRDAVLVSRTPHSMTPFISQTTSSTGGF
jgi:hypothetical protein